MAEEELNLSLKRKRKKKGDRPSQHDEHSRYNRFALEVWIEALHLYGLVCAS